MIQGKGLLIFIFYCFIRSTFSFNPFTFIKDHSYCVLAECCNDHYVMKDFKTLSADLKKHVFGQPFVEEEVVRALTAHYYENENPRKALVMSFHGTPGTGKNFVTDFIAKSIYRKHNSKFVHYFNGLKDFSNEARVELYKENIRNTVENAVKQCPTSLFVFDEVDVMPSGVFDAITPFLDYHTKVSGMDYRKAVFIFLSNSGGVEIASKLDELYTYKKVTRSQLKLHDFEETLEKATYNVPGGLQYSKTIESALIDHFIPFLPLEKSHILKCIEVEFKRLGIKSTEENINEMLNFVTFDGIYSKNGCKRLNNKAMLLRKPTNKKEL